MFPSGGIGGSEPFGKTQSPQMEAETYSHRRFGTALSNLRIRRMVSLKV